LRREFHVVSVAVTCNCSCGDRSGYPDQEGEHDKAADHGLHVHQKWAIRKTAEMAVSSQDEYDGPHQHKSESDDCTALQWRIPLVGVARRTVEPERA
jgi:hypothetical protein